MSLLPRFRDFLRDRTGAITVEFVITVPIFLIALGFAFEFGQYFLAHQSTVNNVRSAARYLARTPAGADDVARAINIVRTGRVIGGAAPVYLEDAVVEVQPVYRTFTTTQPPLPADRLRTSAQTLRIRAVVDVPLTVFGFVEPEGRPSLRFVVVEDLRKAGV